MTPKTHSKKPHHSITPLHGSTPLQVLAYAFRWWADGGPLIVVIVSSLP